MEVWSRLWPSTVVGRRSYRNTLALLRDVANRMDFHGLLLIVTDGFDLGVATFGTAPPIFSVI